MYGKFFAQTFTGSMFGSGAHVFAVWGYAIANADVRGYVEINATSLAATLGEPKEKIVAALKKLIGPDKNSRSKAEDGARLVREGQFIYRIVNHEIYRGMRDQEERRAKQRHQKNRTWPPGSMPDNMAQRPVISEQPQNSISKRQESLDIDGRDRPKEKEKEKDLKNKRSAEPGGPAPAALLTYPCAGQPRTWDLGEDQAARWRLLFPGVDVLASCRKALAWIEANPTRRKTARGMMRFLAAWLGRDQDRGLGGDGLRPNGNGPPSGGGDLEEAARRLLRKDAVQ